MPNIKKIIFPYSQTGLTTVCIVMKQMATGHFLDHVDGAYKAAPANPYVPLPELATPEQGTYERNENRTVWADGLYRGLVYPDATGTKAPIGSEEMYIKDDVEIISEADIKFVFDCIKNKKYLVKVGSVWYLKIRNADDNADIVNKALKDKSGNNITDIHAGILAQELKSDV